MRLSLSSGPATEPLTLAEAKLHLKVETSVVADDALITALIKTARQVVERRTNRQLITATWKGKLDAFPPYREPMVIPLAPLIGVTDIKFLDGAGAEQTWSAAEYVVDAPAGPQALDGRVYLGYEKEYPATGRREDAVTITFTAGYGAAAANVPEVFKQAMYLLIGHWYLNREAVVVGQSQEELPWAVEALLAPYQRLSVMIA